MAAKPQAGGEGLDLGMLLVDLPPPPDPGLDPYLDAAARCFARYGVARTSVPDVAAEAGVSRSTVYRLLGTVEDILERLILRELHRFLSLVPQLIGSRPGPDAVIDLVTTFATGARANPVIDKILADEPQLVGPRLLKDIPNILDQEVTLLAPVLAAAMQLGLIAERDPQVLANWLARITLSVIVTPPDGDLRAFVAALLEPVLQPAPDRLPTTEREHQ